MKTSLRNPTIRFLGAGLFALTLIGISLSVASAADEAELKVIQMRALAESGNAEAQYNLGLMYFQGSGVAQSHADAAKWWLLAAEQGDREAQQNLASMYSHGVGVTKDLEKAAKWARKAAENGDAIAQYNLGAMYFHGHGVPMDKTEAVTWYRRAAEQGDPDAQYNLGASYSSGEGVEQNYVLGYMWWELAATQGDEAARANIKRLEPHLTSEQIVEAQKLASEWQRTHPPQSARPDIVQLRPDFLESAEAGNAEAQFDLGTMYATGQGVPQNLGEAAKWFQKAAEQGNAEAQDTLARMYLAGLGVEKNLVRAYMWASLSRAQGIQGAREGVEFLKSQMTREQIAEAQRMATEWQEKNSASTAD